MIPPPGGLPSYAGSGRAGPAAPPFPCPGSSGAVPNSSHSHPHSHPRSARTSSPPAECSAAPRAPRYHCTLLAAGWSAGRSAGAAAASAAASGAEWHCFWSATPGLPFATAAAAGKAHRWAALCVPDIRRRTSGQKGFSNRSR